MKEFKWFAVYTRPKWEKRVTKSLLKKQIKVYCPLNKVDQLWGDRKKIAGDPLFVSCVFVCLDEKQQTIVMQTRGVFSFLYWLGKPAEISNEEIDAIKLFLEEYQFVTLEKTQVNVNDHVRTISDPLILRKGNVLEVRNSNVKVVLPSLGQILIAGNRKENVTHQDELILKRV